MKLFLKFDSDGSMSVTYDEFREGLESKCGELFVKI